MALAALWATSSASAATSELWGTDGEAFDPTGRLIDWSYAGYQAGESALPQDPVTHNVLDHGAIPDDDQDDTAAIQAAIAAAAEAGGVVGLPAGTFVLQQTLTLPSGVVLRGAGSGDTVLDIPVSLTDAYGNSGLESGGTSSYAFGGGFIEASGAFNGQIVATVVEDAARGAPHLEVSDTTGIAAGDWLRLRLTDVEGTLIARLHSDLLPGGSDNLGDAMDLMNRVTAIDGDTLELDRALPVDVETRWTPTLHAFSPSVTGVGVEGLTMSFPLTTYPGHFQERGYNAVNLRRVAHSWVRDVTILNADYGVSLSDAFFSTVQDVTLATTGDRGELAGHHGLNNGHGADNLFIGFDIQTTFVHDLTNEWYASGVVFTKGRGVDLRMDHHRGAPYATLWTELDCGAGTSPFVSGGRGDRGPHTASYDTLWNVTADVDMGKPDFGFGPRMNFVGFRTAETHTTFPYDWWIELIAPEDLEPANLWEAMVERRLGTGEEVGDDPEGLPESDSDDAAAGDGDPATPEAEDVGCGCRVTPPGGAGFGPLVLVWGWRRRRRAGGRSTDTR